jgi:hypothetical protein
MDLKREMDNKGLDPKLAYFFGEMFEHVIALSQDLDKAMTVLLELAEQMGSFVELHRRTQEGVQHILSRGKVEGVDVSSVSIFDKPKDN